ncbi:MAG: hypothetical protein M5U22_00165 [Thermoleophilia bacterium]|nr:hypothetical protein [Thermoleophilia bacterium]
MELGNPTGSDAPEVSGKRPGSYEGGAQADIGHALSDAVVHLLRVEERASGEGFHGNDAIGALVDQPGPLLHLLAGEGAGWGEEGVGQLDGFQAGELIGRRRGCGLSG